MDGFVLLPASSQLVARASGHDLTTATRRFEVTYTPPLPWLATRSASLEVEIFALRLVDVFIGRIQAEGGSITETPMTFGGVPFKEVHIVHEPQMTLPNGNVVPDLRSKPINVKWLMPPQGPAVYLKVRTQAPYPMTAPLESDIITRILSTWRSARPS